MLSPIQLLDHRLVDLHITPVEPLTQEQIDLKAIAIKHKVAWGQNPQDPQMWAVRLRIELVPGEEESPSLYLGSVEMMGQFAVHPEVEKENALDLVVVNGSAMLYTCIREWVANITARSLHGIVELPTVNPAMFRPPATGPEAEATDAKA